jgi:hypothetical protein
VQVSDIKDGDIIVLVWGCKPQVKTSCVEVRTRNGGVQIADSVWGDASYHITYMYSKLDTIQHGDFFHYIYEDWGQLFARKVGYGGEVEQLFISEINPCNRCKHRLHKLCGGCLGKFEARE